MPSSIERIVDAYVRLRNRSALEELRDRRQRLVDDLNELQSSSVFDSNLALRSMAEDLVAINAGVERLEVPAPVGIAAPKAG
jgi:hypothetical protein